MRQSKHVSCSSSNKHRPHRDDRSGWYIRRVVAGHRYITIARGHLSIDPHRRASDLNRRLVRRRLLKSIRRRRRDVWRSVVRSTPNRRGSTTHDLHITTQPTTDNSSERMRQRRRNRIRRTRNHSNVHISSDNLVALFRCWLSHTTVLNHRFDGSVKIDLHRSVPSVFLVYIHGGALHVHRGGSLHIHAGAGFNLRR